MKFRCDPNLAFEFTPLNAEYQSKNRIAIPRA
jgi:hypothetical protein